MPPYAALGATLACRHEAWEVALDRVELDLVRVERAITTGTGLTRIDEWQVPEYYGPIPSALRPRAEAILARQRLAMPRIAEQLGTTAQHQALVDGVTQLSTTHPSDLAIYVDVSA